MSWTKDWRKAFKDLKREEGYDGNVFGPNCWFDDDSVIEHFSKLESLGATIELNIEHWESVRIYPPRALGSCVQVLIYILTISPSSTEVIYHKKRGRNNLEITWS